jgi:uracil-DNA glycosylase family 4
MTAEWDKILKKIKTCKKCQGINPQVRADIKKIPTIAPKNIELLFISEAPPLGSSYFYWGHSKDVLRKRIFAILNSIGYKVESLEDFVGAGFYLTPTVKCPSEENGKNASPSNNAIKFCLEHLMDELNHIKPKKICLLGKTALYGFSQLFPQFKGGKLKELAGEVKEVEIGGRKVRAMINYWPSYRQRNFDKIVEHIRRIV